MLVLAQKKNCRLQQDSHNSLVSRFASAISHHRLHREVELDLVILDREVYASRKLVPVT
jgi:hypothetical protein